MFLYLYLGFIVFAGVAVAFMVYWISDYADAGDSATAGGYTSAVVLFLGLLLVFPIMAGNVPREYSEVKTGLAALNTDSELEGSYSSVFFIASGTVGDREVYRYISVDEGGGYRVEEINMDDVVVFMDATAETAHMVTPFHAYQDWFVPWDTTGRDWDRDIEFHIPEGSVKTGLFNVSID